MDGRRRKGCCDVTPDRECCHTSGLRCRCPGLKVGHNGLIDLFITTARWYKREIKNAECDVAKDRKDGSGGSVI
jgi:hypothetical protein